MFGIGTSEFLIVALVALIVLGPERLPKAARFAGVWIRRARTQWYSVKSELERELEAEELKRSVQDAQRSIEDVGTQLRDAGQQARDGMDQVRRGTEDLIASARRMPGDPPADVSATDRAEGAIAADPTAPPAPAPDAAAPHPQDTGDGVAR